MKNKYELIAMDLDGTLTQHKSKLDETNKAVLCQMAKKYKLVMIGAGGCRRIYDQMNGFPIDIVGNYGIQQSTIENGEFKIIRNDKYEIDKGWFEDVISSLRQLTGYTDFVGESVEFHESGLVTFPLIGTKAILDDKLRFDPDGKKRSAIYDLVAGSFPGYNCFIGGTSSFDIPKQQYNKYDALMNYAEKYGIMKEQILFLGDDFKKGGNDEHIKLNHVDYIKIDDYRDLGVILKREHII